MKGRIDSAGPDFDNFYAGRSSDLLSFVAGLRDALREGDSALGVDDSRGVSNVSNKASTSKFQAESGENSRKWTIKQPRPFRPLGASRADIVRIIRMRNMSKPELSLRKEISHQEKWLRKHSGLVDTSAYRYAVQVLARNQRHLAKYKKRPTEFRDLPTGVKRRKWRFKEEMEWDDRRAEGNAFWQKFGKAGVSRRRASDLGDLVSGSFGEM